MEPLTIRFLIGPGDEHWDAAMLVRHRSVTDFLAFAANQDSLARLGQTLATTLLQGQHQTPFRGSATGRRVVGRTLTGPGDHHQRRSLPLPSDFRGRALP